MNRVHFFLMSILFLISSGCTPNVKQMNKDGDAYLSLGNTQEAIEKFKQAIKLDPENTTTLANLCTAYKQTNQTDLADQTCLKASTLKSEEIVEWHLKKTLSFRRNEKYDLALTEVNKALDVLPLHNESLITKALIYGKIKQYRKRIDTLRKAVNTGSKRPQAYNNLAYLLATSSNSSYRDGEEALELALKAVDLANKPNPIYIDTLAAAYAEVGQFDNAVNSQQKAINILKTQGRQDLVKKWGLIKKVEFYQANKPWRDDS